MGAMSRNEKPGEPQPLLLPTGLLVFGLLIGLLGMHGLGSAPAAAHMTGHVRTAEPQQVAAVMDAPDECGHDGHGRSGHVDHADATCASSGVAGSPVLPTLVPAAIGHAEGAEGPITATGSGADGGRAPPSLSELQLLRI
jgi:hypothetical protein